MSKSLLFLAVILAASLSGCAADSADQQAPILETTLVSVPPIAERLSSYTSTQAVHVKGAVVGFLVTFGEVPITDSEPTYTEAGSVLVKNPDFETIGFITPRGAIYRYGPGNRPEMVYQGNLVKNLSMFFGSAENEIAVQDI